MLKVIFSEDAKEDIDSITIKNLDETEENFQDKLSQPLVLQKKKI
ncbi:MAG: hypothetical protein ACOCXH_09510 [Cyclobacteriaceae bacterium]